MEFYRLTPSHLNFFIVDVWLIGVPVSDRQILRTQAILVNLRSSQHDIIRQVDIVLHKLDAIRGDYGTIPIDIHTGVEMESGRRQAIYDDCLREYVRLYKLLTGNTIPIPTDGPQ